MRPPAFWAHDGILPRLLSPVGDIVGWRTAARVARPGWTAPVPVICCGNASVGGTGKTPLALDLGARLIARGRRPAFLSRGHGGAGRGARRAGDDVRDSGDEPLLLAEVAPTWLGRDRAASARAAINEGADVLLMDDGLQNPTLAKSMSFLVVDGATGFGNGRVLPAGPLREPAAAAAGRCRAMVLVGEGAAPEVGLPALRARLLPRDPGRFAGRRVLAFAGIGRPDKMFATLDVTGAVTVATRAFPDHHRYRASELQALAAEAGGAALVTTAKDAVRLPPEWRARVEVLRVDLAWDDPGALEALLDEALPR